MVLQDLIHESETQKETIESDSESELDESIKKQRTSLASNVYNKVQNTLLQSHWVEEIEFVDWLPHTASGTLKRSAIVSMNDPEYDSELRELAFGEQFWGWRKKPNKKSQKETLNVATKS